MRARGKSWKSVYRVVRRIPAGRVATYGQVAAWADMPGAARQVGWVSRSGERLGPDLTCPRTGETYRETDGGRLEAVAPR